MSSSAVAAELVSDLKSKGVSVLIGDYHRVGKETDTLGRKFDLLGAQASVLWKTIARDSKTVAGDLKTVDRSLGELKRSLDGVGRHNAFTRLATDARTLQTGLASTHGAVGKLQTALNGLKLPKLSWPGGGGSGGGLSLGLPNPLGIVGGIVGGAAGLAGNVLGAGLNVVGAGAGMAASYAGDALTKAMTLDQKRAIYAAYLGGSAKDDAAAAQAEKAALALGARKDVGPIGAPDAMDVFMELAKAGYDPAAITDAKGNGMGKAVLQMKAASGGDLTAEKAAQLLVKTKSAFGGEKLSDEQIANLLVGYANSTPLGLGDIASQISSGGATWAGSGGKLQDFLIASALEANAGTNKGQIGGGLKQIINQSDPKSKTNIAAMAALGLIKTETHTEGAVAATPGTKAGEVYVGGAAAGRSKAVRGTKGKKGKVVTTVVDGTNKLWGPDGNLASTADIVAAIGEGTKGMTPHQIENLVKDAMGAKAANYLMPLINAYRADPTVVKRVTQNIKDQGDASKISAKMTDNLKDSWDNLGKVWDTIQTTSALPFLNTLKGFVDWGATLGNDVVSGDWGQFRKDFFGMFGDLGPGMAKNWDTYIAPTLNKVLDWGKTIAGDVATGDWGKAKKDLKDALDDIFGTGTSKSVGDLVGDVKNAFTEGATFLGSLHINVKDLETAWNTAAGIGQGLMDMAGKVKDAWDIGSSIVDQLNHISDEVAIKMGLKPDPNDDSTLTKDQYYAKYPNSARPYDPKQPPTVGSFKPGIGAGMEAGHPAPGSVGNQKLLPVQGMTPPVQGPGYGPFTYGPDRDSRPPIVIQTHPGDTNRYTVAPGAGQLKQQERNNRLLNPQS